MRRYRPSAVLVAGMLFVLPSLSSAQDTDPIPGLDLPSFDVPLPDIPDIDIPDIDVAPPEIDFSLTLDVPIFDVDVVVQLAPGDPIPDVDVTLGIDIPDIPDIPDFAEAPPEVEFSFTLDTDLFEVDVEVQLAPGDPIPDVDVTLRPCCRPPPPPPDDECSEDGCD